VETHYWDGDRWQSISINNYETTGFLSPEQCIDILHRNDPHIPIYDDDPERFLQKANSINEMLHENEVPVGERAHVLAALLLSLARDSRMRIHERPSDLAREINGNITEILRDHGKEEFAQTIALTLPATPKNHRKYRNAFVGVLQILREMNIRSAINSGDDALGKFYETFLKFANGAKEMGIVLTPRHITKFAVDVVGLGPKDKVYDPACGTGGFLVAAMDHLRKKLALKHPKSYKKFQAEGLTGIEQRDDVYGLALVNMIFRGDGKSHIYDGNCFDHQFWCRDGKVFYDFQEEIMREGAVRPFSRVLMNPPFKLKNCPERKFVDHALQQMKPNGILFAVLPFVVIEGKKKHAIWRKELLKRHTVIAVIKLDKNVFYPIAEGTYALILRAHTPHPPDNDVFMGVLMDDDHRARRSKMLSSYISKDNVKRVTADLRAFIVGKPVCADIPREQIITRISSESCDLSPEAHLRNKAPVPPIHTAVRAAHLSFAEEMNVNITANIGNDAPYQTHRFPLSGLIKGVIPPPLKKLKDYPEGTTPVVSATYYENGIAEWLDIPQDLRIRNCMTISKTHNTRPCEAFWHPYEFSAIPTVFIVQPIDIFAASKLAMIYLCQAVTASNAWRYDYARRVRLYELEVYLPTRNGDPDIAMIEEIVERQIRTDG